MKREEIDLLAKEQLVDLVLQQAETIALLHQHVSVLAERVEQLEAEVSKLKPPKGKSTPDWVKPNQPKSEPKPSKT